MAIMTVVNRTPSHYREQAVHLQKMADVATSEDLKEQLQVLAKDYADLAARAERTATRH
jgi:hypothetical protein